MGRFLHQKIFNFEIQNLYYMIEYIDTNRYKLIEINQSLLFPIPFAGYTRYDASANESSGIFHSLALTLYRMIVHTQRIFRNIHFSLLAHTNLCNVHSQSIRYIVSANERTGVFIAIYSTHSHSHWIVCFDCVR